MDPRFVSSHKTLSSDVDPPGIAISRFLNSEHRTLEPAFMPERPNLLYIHSDQHNPFVTGCYGDTVVETPHLDRLAGRGVVLDTVYCPSPICVPSRMSMLSGRFPHGNEVWTNNHSLDTSIPTMAHAMGAVGYRPRPASSPGFKAMSSRSLVTTWGRRSIAVSFPDFD